jgi:hypothetical protein
MGSPEKKLPPEEARQLPHSTAPSHENGVEGGQETLPSDRPNVRLPEGQALSLMDSAPHSSWGGRASNHSVDRRLCQS